MERRKFTAVVGSAVLGGLSGCTGYERYLAEMNRRAPGGAEENPESGQDHDQNGSHHEQDDGGSHHEQGGGRGHDHGASLDEPVERAEVAMQTNDGHHFMPHLVWVRPGGTVTWTCESGKHTATAYHPSHDTQRRVPAEASEWDSGLLGSGDAFELTFEEAGVYDYFCRPHEQSGMVGSVLVGRPDPHDQPGLEPPEESIPAEARTVIEKLNEKSNRGLGHEH